MSHGIYPGPLIPKGDPLTGVGFLHVHLEWVRLGRHGGKVDKEEDSSLRIYTHF